MVISPPVMSSADILLPSFPCSVIFPLIGFNFLMITTTSEIARLIQIPRKNENYNYNLCDHEEDYGLICRRMPVGGKP